MPDRFRRILLCIGIICLVPVTLLCFAFCMPAQYDRTYLAALQDKTDLLRTTEGKRIILIGGSGAAFDIRSDLLEAELPGYTPVNFGLYAGLGTTVMLDLSQKYLREGDIVVFLPEQNAQTLSTYFDAKSLWQAMDGRYGDLSALPASYYPDMAGAFPAYSSEKARCFWDGEKPSGDAVYARGSFNGYGDMACGGRERNVMGYGYDPNTPIRFDGDLCSDAFLDKVNAFHAQCSKGGIAVYYAFCPMNAAALLTEDTEGMERFQDALAARLDCPVLGSVEEAVMDAGWFFDTNFHLNTAGQVVYTARLASDLKKELGMKDTVSIQVPEMPVPEVSRIVDGDNRDEDLFTYERAGDGYRITGLSDAGAEKEELIIPFRHLGMPVIGFSADTFRHNASIREIRIDGNITLIEDGSFDGCTGLIRICMRNAFPQTCSVGKALLKGTDAVICVPEEAFSAYATNYFWSLYADRLEKGIPE